MGMILRARRLTATQVEAMDAAPDLAITYMFGEDDPDELDLDKAWHGIHFLLTGSAWETTDGVGEAVLGGDPVGPDNGYGPCRLLRADQVRTVAAGLSALTTEALRSRYDAAALDDADVYPQIWDESDVFATYLAPNYAEMRKFYATAAARSAAVLLCVS